MNILLLGATALTLGLRHGVDIDHIAAILDMAGTSATETCQSPKTRSLKAMLADLKLPVFYVLGHGLMVVILGLLALGFGAVIPKWVGKLMERTVGVTLLLLSIYLTYSLFMFATKGQDFKLRSRWMILFASAANAWSWIQRKLLKREHHKHSFSNWDNKGAFTIGLVHGFGAETGTRALVRYSGWSRELCRRHLHALRFHHRHDGFHLDDWLVHGRWTGNITSLQGSDCDSRYPRSPVQPCCRLVFHLRQW
jgi:high-affinity nickel permease